MGKRWRKEVEANLDNIRREITLRAESAAVAITTASAALDVRLNHSNGLIEQMAKQAAEFARRETVEDLAKQVSALQQGRAGGQTLEKVILIILGALAGYFFSRLL